MKCMFDSWKSPYKCRDCGCEFISEVEEQVAGFRTPDELYCPWCGALIERSMRIEWVGSVIEKEGDKAKKRSETSCLEGCQRNK